MDSGDSMQSSSGGDEEYDSRSESISTFLNSSGHMSNPQPPPPSHHHNHPSPMFDPLSNFLDPFSRSASNPIPNSLLIPDMVWSRVPRSEPNCTEIGGLLNSLPSIQPISGAQGPGRTLYPNTSSMPLPIGSENGARTLATSDQTNVVRNSKKRSRASRRAPTTVLTTDTSNFRAMVQEFTGIPAAPFSALPFSRSRFDLFPSSSTMRSSHLEQPPPYLLRHFTQKMPPSFVSSPSFSTSTMVDSIASTTYISNTTSTTAATSNSTSTNNYQLPPDLGLAKQSQNMQNPILTFQSLLQSSSVPHTKYPLPVFGATSQGPSSILPTDSRLKMAVLEDFGMSHGHVNTHLSGVQSLEPCDGMSLRSWGDIDGDDQGHLKSFNGIYGN